MTPLCYAAGLRQPDHRQPGPRRQPAQAGQPAAEPRCSRWALRKRPQSGARQRAAVCSAPASCPSAAASSAAAGAGRVSLHSDQILLTCGSERWSSPGSSCCSSGVVVWTLQGFGCLAACRHHAAGGHKAGHSLQLLPICDRQALCRRTGSSVPVGCLHLVPCHVLLCRPRQTQTG